MLDAHYLPSNFNECFELTTKKLATLAREPRIAFLSRQLRMVNEAEASFNNRWEELKEELYADQQLYAFDLIASLQKAPKVVDYVDRNGVLRSKEVLGVTAIAPTGAGKTHLMEMCITVIADSSVDRSIVIVVPSLQLQGQLMAKFRKDLSHLRIGSMSSTVHDSPKDNELMIITEAAFNANFRNNTLCGHRVDMLMIDEGHHLTAPEFSQTWLQHWSGHTMAFTATPAYSLTKDVRNMLPHIIEHADTLDLIDQERLNDGQIFTLVIDEGVFTELVEEYGIDPAIARSPEMIREVIDSMVIDFVKPLIEEGRRGIIFCEPGNVAENAQKLARRLAATPLANGRLIRAEAMYSEAKNQHAVIADYRDGQLDVVTTVDTGRESLDTSFDFVLMNCAVKSRLRGTQIVGRGTRLGEKFKVTVYAQFIDILFSGSLTKDTKKDRRFFLIEEAFGELPGKFYQGRTLRGRRAKQAGQGASPEDKAVAKRMIPGTIDLTKFSLSIQRVLAKVDHRPIGESLYRSQQNQWVVEEGMQSLSSALIGYDIQQRKAMLILRSAGFTWRGKYEEVDGKKTLVHYYTPEAIAYLHSRLPKGRVFNMVEAAEYLDVSVELFEHIASDPKNGVEGRQTARPGRRTTTCYDGVAMAMAKNALKKIPGTQPGDKPAQEVAKKFNVDTRTILRLLGLQDSKRYLVNGAFQLTAAEVVEAETIFAEHSAAKPTDKYLSAIAEVLDVDTSFVRGHMTSAEEAQGAQKRYNDKRGYVQFGTVWPEEHWKPMVARLEKLKPRPLEAHLIPLNKRTLSAMVRYGVRIDAEALTKELAANGYPVEDVSILDNKVTSHCVPWPVIAALQQQRGEPRYTHRTPKLDFSRLPAGPDDVDSAKIAYAQEIQRSFLRPEQLRNYERDS